MINDVGLAGARRNGSAAVVSDGLVIGACEYERLSRHRAIGLSAAPPGAIDALLIASRVSPGSVSHYIVAEEGLPVPPGAEVKRVPHAEAHAAAAFLTSPFADGIVLVCDTQSRPEVTVWRGYGASVAPLDWPWEGPGPAWLFARAAAAFAAGARGDAHELEILARVGCPTSSPCELATYSSEGLRVDPSFDQVIHDARRDAVQSGVRALAGVAASVQQQIGALVVELVRDVVQKFGDGNLCLGGGLFYNTTLTTMVTTAAGAGPSFVPPHPGNPGLAIGAVLAAQGRRPPLDWDVERLAFLGPSYDALEIKSLLDNCKLSYDYVDEDALIARTSAALASGALVGWFQGRMEWGPRALGNRSILASPFSPYVLENLNTHLKGVAPHRTYGVVLCEEDAARHFVNSRPAPLMELEFAPLDRERMRHVLPLDARQIRVQTVGGHPARLRRLLKAFEVHSGCGLLVNTSLNSSLEPMACSPRDAVRIFYSSGLDMLVLDRFVLHK